MKKIIFVAFALCAIVSFGQEKIKRAKDNLKDEPLENTEYIPMQVNSVSSTRSKSYDDDDEMGIGTMLAIGLAWFPLVESPLTIDKEMRNAELQPYPYFQKSKGDYSYTQDRDFIFRTHVSDYFLKSNYVKANQLQVNLRIGDRFGFSPSYTHYWGKENDKTERLDLFYATIDYYRIRTQIFTLNWGVGAAYLGNEVKKGGLALNFGAGFHIKPISVKINYKTAFLGGDLNDNADQFEFNPTFHFKQYEVGAKYFHHKIGGVKFNGVGFGAGIYF
ncbi:hypothetical protein EDM00_00835 [Ornithobacterium rhinotracheale]|uniref:hypothetical protein n=1 Tax=Ornithobacterium rhinotracheale TaxID=28251 RepID=UPI00129D0EF6|nr:hypothetical protein [Ornithobacterium rhinotracheale]MRI62546.1 hypothetical protein [Ornithobacterium rhinotracheale]